MKKKNLSSLTLVLALTMCLSAGAQNQKRVPGVDDLLNIRQAGGAQISPEGKRVAYTVSEADYKQDAFVKQIWLAEVDTGHYIFGDPLPDFATPDIPGKESKR